MFTRKELEVCERERKRKIMMDKIDNGEIASLKDIVKVWSNLNGGD